MKVLVTGGAGYVGGVSVDALVEAGHSVVILDDLTTGHRAAANAAARLVVGSYADPATIGPLLEAERPDAILHCAARSVVGESVRDPGFYYRDNVAGGIALLEAARAAGVASLVFSSTAAVYGVPDRTPIEEDAALRPINPYGETKRTLEGALRWYGAAYGLRSVSLRYFNVAGATQRLGEVHRPETHLIPNALNAADGGPPLTVFGDSYPTPDGTPIRDYIHVADLADAHVAALTALTNGDGGQARRPRVQPGHVERVLRARGPGGRRRRGRPADPPCGRRATSGRPAGARGVERPRPRGPRLAATPLDAGRDDRIGVGVAARAPERLRRLRRRP